MNSILIIIRYKSPLPPFIKGGCACLPRLRSGPGPVDRGDFIDIDSVAEVIDDCEKI